MSGPEVLSLVLLVAVFALALWRDVNVGLVAMPAAFLLGRVAGVPKEQILAGFPAGIVALIVGVMYMFGHAQRSGAIDRVVHGIVRISGGRDWILPWSLFAVGAVLSGIGTLPSATVAIVLPVAMRVARNRGIDPVLMAIVAAHGAGAGGFSPMSPWAAIIESLAAKAGVHYSPDLLFLGLAGFDVLSTAVFFFALGGLGLVRRGRTSGDGGPSADADADARPLEAVQGASRITPYEIGSLAGLGFFVLGVLVLDLNIVFAAFAVGLVLHLAFRPDGRRVVADIPWGVVMLTIGVLVYVGDLEATGTLKTISGHLGGIGAPVVAALAIAYVAALFATVESSTVAVLGVVVPLAAAVLPHQTSAQFTALLIAVCGTIGGVAISPLHLGGGLVLASVDDGDHARVFRWLLGWSVGAAIVLPALLMLLPISLGL
ncbi:SLC13 family permease [Actinomadura sp. NPDC048394]|uniref:SLC13 family permease n=1 Tax=Actinomadura sp. NPDC048394 TaxID=3158223 RepID=UPI0033C79EEB